MSYPRESLGHSPASIAHARQVSHPKRLISGASPLTEPCPDGQCVTTMWAAGHWEEQPVGAPSRSTSPPGSCFQSGIAPAVKSHDSRLAGRRTALSTGEGRRCAVRVSYGGTASAVDD